MGPTNKTKSIIRKSFHDKFSQDGKNTDLFPSGARWVRQENLALNNHIDSIVIAGCGGGFYTAQALSLQDCMNIYLFDGDMVSYHNLNRVPFPKDSIGKNKAIVVKEMLEPTSAAQNIFAFPFNLTYEVMVWQFPFLFGINREISNQVWKEFFNESDLSYSNLTKVASFLVDATDTQEVARAYLKATKGRSNTYYSTGVTKYIREGCEGFYVNTYSGTPMIAWQSKEQTCREANQWVVPQMLASAYTVNIILANLRYSYRNCISVNKDVRKLFKRRKV